MEEIVQLKKREYDSLFEKANLNEELINEKAQSLYEKKGTYGIKLKLEFKNAEWSDEISFKSYSYVQDWDGQFPISEADKKKIVKFVNRRADEFMEKHFGEQIHSMVYYNKKLESLKKLRIKYNTITILGWLIAFSVMCYLACS